ncbi:MAG: hypothetical protein QXK94_10295 [Candidatus Jordarchaeales archaeon]
MKARNVLALALIFSLFLSTLAVLFAPKTIWLTIPYRDVETHDLTFTVEAGKYYDVNFYLPSGYSVNFSFNLSGPTFMRVYLMDSENFKRYEEGKEDYTSILTIDAIPGEVYQENYTAARSDRYHLVFENFIFNASVSLVIDLEVPRFLFVPYRT